MRIRDARARAFIIVRCVVVVVSASSARLGRRDACLSHSWSSATDTARGRLVSLATVCDDGAIGIVLVVVLVFLLFVFVFVVRRARP